MLAISKFDIPGEYGFPLNSVYAKPASPQESGEFRSILAIRPPSGRIPRSILCQFCTFFILKSKNFFTVLKLCHQDIIIKGFVGNKFQMKHSLSSYENIPKQG